jgi:transketolase C-terminal domain/subunit
MAMLRADYVQRESILREINLDKKYIKITRENLCHRYSSHGKSFETGMVPVTRYSHPLSSVLFKNSTH